MSSKGAEDQYILRCRKDRVGGREGFYSAYMDFIILAIIMSRTNDSDDRGILMGHGRKMVQGFLVVWVSRDSSIDSEIGCSVSHDSGKLREVSERRHERTKF